MIYEKLLAREGIIKYNGQIACDSQIYKSELSAWCFINWIILRLDAAVPHLKQIAITHSSQRKVRTKSASYHKLYFNGLIKELHKINDVYVILFHFLTFILYLRNLNHQDFFFSICNRPLQHWNLSWQSSLERKWFLCALKYL